MALPDWARAHGPALFSADIRTEPADFDVTEHLGWALSGTGEHDYLRIEKTGANTEWVARQLARHAGVPAKDVGYAGLKDRRAVTRQWFSVPRRNSPQWSSLEIDGVSILDRGRHDRKLRRGAHRANAFVIVLRGRGLGEYATSLEARLDTVREQGVPNYFGEQRFGRDATNLRLADQWASGKKMPRHARSLAISTMRSFLFNTALDGRVRDGTWNKIVAGDVANLDGTRSVFDVADADEEIARRCARMDVHPAGELAGEGSTGRPAEWIDALHRGRVRPGMRSLRMRVIDPAVEISDTIVRLSFSLGRGSYATSVLREMVVANPK